MNRIRGKLNQYHQDIRKDKREKMMSEQRVWKQMPSVIVELPYCIDHSDWTYIEELLDSIAQQDIAILDQPLITYLQDKYNSQFNQQSQKQWEQTLKFNILRIIMRLRLAKDYQTCKLLNLLQEANQNLKSQPNIQSLQILLKLIKQLAIFLQVTAEANQQNNKIWTEDNLKLMNHVCLNLRIYSFDYLGRAQSNNLLNNYHVYYAYLLADTRIHFKQNQLIQNIQEIYHIIHQCLRGTDSLEIIKSIDIINKIINQINRQDQNSSFLLNSLEILLIDGYGSFKEQLPSQYSRSLQKKLNFKGIFLTKLLSIVSNTDILNVIKIIEHLAKLIQISDNFIEAIFKVHLELTINEPKNTSQQRQVTILRPKRFKNYSEFICFSMQNLLCEVRYKAYWLISNILGSDKYFSQNGLQFLRQIYCNNYLNLQRGSTHIQNEIYFCILNYFCNISDSIHIKDLLNIEALPSNQQINQNNQINNSFYYLLNILIGMMEQLSQTLQKEGLSFYHGKEDIFLHRIVYCFYNLLKVLQEQNNIGNLTYQSLINLMQKNNVALHVELILDKIHEYKHISIEIQSLLELILKHFSTQTDRQNPL